MKYFIGNWKMFGVPKSVSILNKINSFYSKDKNRNKYRVIITPPYTLIESYSKYFKNKKISIGAQNCYQKEQFSSNTAAISMACLTVRTLLPTEVPIALATSLAPTP